MLRKRLHEAAGAAGPTVTSILLGGFLLWLAGGPFEAWVARPITPLALLEPVGDLDSFPTRFEWGAVGEAEYYEVSTLWLDGPGSTSGTLLFRQNGWGNRLDVELAGPAPPGPADFVWEVRALRADRVVAAGRGEFRVLATNPTR